MEILILLLLLLCHLSLTYREGYITQLQKVGTLDWFITRQRIELFDSRSNNPIHNLFSPKRMDQMGIIV